MRYFRRHWDETRGDQHDDWGTATYYFEVAADGNPTRQMEIYANGKVLQYDQRHVEDSFGMLADQPLDTAEFTRFEILATEFEQAWSSHRPDNR